MNNIEQLEHTLKNIYYMLPISDKTFEETHKELHKTLKDMKLILFSIEEKLKTGNMWMIDKYLESLMSSLENFINSLRKIDVVTSTFTNKIEETKRAVEDVKRKVVVVTDPYKFAYEHLDEFREFLRDKGLSDMTIYLYIKALIKYINNEKLSKTERTYISALLNHVKEFVRKKVGLNT